MALPTSPNTFTLPSLYDNVELQCRLYFPKRQQDSENPFVRGFSIFAHPYAPLGGSYDDPVVNSVGSTLLKQGFVLATFNFRGAEGSAGHTSWSGKPELGDYVSVVAFILCFIQAPGVLEHVKKSSLEDNRPPWLLLGGYSYGSMIASHVPTLRIVQTLMTSVSEGSSEYEIYSRAQDLSKAFLGYAEFQQHRGRNGLRVNDSYATSGQGVAIGGYESEAAARRISRESSRRSVDKERVRESVERVRLKMVHRGSSRRGSEVMGKVLPGNKPGDLPRVAHLLVSPILGIVSGFTTMFHRLEFEPHGKTLGKEFAKEQLTTTERLTRHPTCAIYGNKDAFTSARKLRNWGEELTREPSSLFTIHEIDNAGHFWHEPGADSQMLKIISAWTLTALD